MATSPIYSWPEPDNTDLVKNGALAIRTLGNAIDTTMGTMVAKTIVDAKGDLIAGTAADTVNRLAVGSNGESLVADSSTSTGLRYGANFAAGKNKVINGDFGIWQRGTSLTATNAFFFTADRWLSYSYGASTTSVSQQTFTPGTAPVAGYEGQYFLRVTSSTTQIYLEHRIEDVRTFAGQTVTISFYAKQATGIAGTLGTALVQVFGSGGSSTVSTTILSSQTTTTGFTRYTGTVTLPSITGKTIGTNNYLSIQMSNGSLNNAFDIWGVQLEAGSVATAFQTATGTLQGELAACQRYYFRTGGSAAYERISTMAVGASSTSLTATLAPPVTMRIAPTAVDFSTLTFWDGGGGLNPVTALTIATAGRNMTEFTVTASAGGITTFRPYFIITNGSTNGYLGLSAEL